MAFKLSKADREKLIGQGREFSVTTKGFDRLLKKMDAEFLLAGGMRKALEAAAIMIESEARARAPNNQGQLVQSITHEVDDAILPTFARVGTNAPQAPWMEFGTGLVHDHPTWPHKVHSPPGPALQVWAERHGIQGGGWAVARGIKKRGGLKPRRYLRGAFEAFRPQVSMMLDKIKAELSAKWGS